MIVRVPVSAYVQVDDKWLQALSIDMETARVRLEDETTLSAAELRKANILFQHPSAANDQKA